MAKPELLPRSSFPKAEALGKEMVAIVVKRFGRGQQSYDAEFAAKKMAANFYKAILATIDDELNYRKMDTVIESFDDLINEGPLDFMKGVAGAAMAQSKNPKQAARGKRIQSRAAAKRFASAGGENRRKAKMVSAMQDMWTKHENDIISKRGQITTQTFNDWFGEFMKGKEFKPLQGSATAGNIKKAITTAVDQNYKAPTITPTAGTPMSPTTKEIPKGTVANYKVDNEDYTWHGAQWISNKTGKTAQKLIGQKLTQQVGGTPRSSNAPKAATPQASASQVTVADNEDAIAGFKALGHNNTEIKAMLKKADDLGADPNNAEDIIRKAMKETKRNELMAKYLKETGQTK